MQLWLAVASSVPSSANMWTRPWPKPRSTACTRMSSSTHSVGTRCTTRSVLSRLFPPPRTPRAWPTPIGTKSPSTASAVASTPSSTSGMRVQTSTWPSPWLPSSWRGPRPFTMRWSSRSLIVPSIGPCCGRGGQSCGRGRSSGRRSHCPVCSSGRCPSAALTVRTSRFPTWQTARACVIWWPSTATVTSTSTTSPRVAYARYCAVAQTHWRPLVPSSAEMAAPRPHPPNRKPPRVTSPGPTSSDHR